MKATMRSIAIFTVIALSSVAIGDLGLGLDVFNPLIGPRGKPQPPDGWLASVEYDEFDDKCDAALIRSVVDGDRRAIGLTVAGVPGKVAHLHDEATIFLKFTYFTLPDEPWAWVESIDSESGDRLIEVIYVWNHGDEVRRARCQALYTAHDVDNGNVEIATLVVMNPRLQGILDKDNGTVEDFFALRRSDFQDIVQAKHVRVRVGGKTIYELNEQDILVMYSFLREIGKGWEGEVKDE